MKANILTGQADGLEMEHSAHLHQRIYRTQETTVKKTKEVVIQSIQTTKLQEPTSTLLILLH